MSGPKSYAPPPRYSMQVFDGKLNEVFRLQTRLKMLCAELETNQMTDAMLNINFDCRKELDGQKKALDKVLKSLIFDYRGTFGQSTYDQIDAEIKKRIADLQNLFHECEAISRDFAAKKTDYENFRSYLLFYQNSKISFEDFKDQIRQYLKKNLEPKSPEIFRETDENIRRVEFEKPSAAFAFGFESHAEREKQAVINHILEKEKIIYGFKDKTGDKLRSEFQGAKGSDLSEEKNAVIERIENLIRRCDHTEIKKGYRSELKKLTESEVLSDAYFYKQLHDTILEAEQTRRTKAEIAGILKRLNKIEFHSSVKNEKHNLESLCFSLLDKSSLTVAETDNLLLKLKQLERLNRERFEEEEIINKERMFLKSQIIVCLENLGYEVMDDLEVIDFEKENDFLLKIRAQENYLNLKFKPDGSIRYIFEIPEEENSLSTDQKNLKLHEMRVTCDEFKTVLQDLAQMGLEINLQSERPVAAESLVSVPQNQRDKLKTKSKQTQSSRQLRERYLDR
jgi:hypothetical protein